ncbi:hypothetical protein ACWDTI_21920 [Gordonia sp. NPDC003424]
MAWFNTEHHHSGIALFTPQSVHDGTWRHTHTIRTTAIAAYHDDHPERFHRPPQVKRPATRVGINLHHEPTTPPPSQATSEKAA